MENNSINKKLKELEIENVETTNVLYEIINKVDNIYSRLKLLEDYLLSDGK
jgi:hypothetical protein